MYFTELVKNNHYLSGTINYYYYYCRVRGDFGFGSRNTARRHEDSGSVGLLGQDQSTMKLYSLFMCVARTLRSRKVAHTLVKYLIRLPSLAMKPYGGFVWPMVLWTC